MPRRYARTNRSRSDMYRSNRSVPDHFYTDQHSVDVEAFRRDVLASEKKVSEITNFDQMLDKMIDFYDMDSTKSLSRYELRDFLEDLLDKERFRQTVARGKEEARKRVTSRTQGPLCHDDYPALGNGVFIKNDGLPTPQLNRQLLKKIMSLSKNANDRKKKFVQLLFGKMDSNERDGELQRADYPKNTIEGCHGSRIQSNFSQLLDMIRFKLNFREQQRHGVEVEDLLEYYLQAAEEKGVVNENDFYKMILREWDQLRKHHDKFNETQDKRIHVFMDTLINDHYGPNLSPNFFAAIKGKIKDTDTWMKEAIEIEDAEYADMELLEQQAFEKYFPKG